MIDIDFGAADFEDVEFRGCRFEGVTFPRNADLRLISGYPSIGRRVLEKLAGDSSMEALMLIGELENFLRMPGKEDSTGVLNRKDYVAAGGDSFADFVWSLFSEAATDLNAS